MMYCSVKFLSPIVTAGLPFPGRSDAAGVDDEPAEDDVLLSLLLPQAVSAMASATASNAASGRAGPLNFRLITVSLPPVGCLPPPSVRQRSRSARAVPAGSPLAESRRRAHR